MTDACPICSRALTAGSFVCGECVKNARKHLASIAKFADWADSKRARMGSTWSIGGGSRGTETPIPYDPRVTEVFRPIHNDLTGWARIAWDEAPTFDTDPSDTKTGSVARWLIGYCGWFSSRQDGQEAFTAWEKANEQLEALYDRAPEKVYLGRCDNDTEFGACPESLYVEKGSVPAHIACTRCGKVIATEDRQAELRVKLEDHLGTARELARLLKLVLGEEASTKMMWAYEKHGLIQSHGTRTEYDTLGRSRQVAVYRIGDVQEAARILASSDEQRKAVRRIMRGIVAS